MTAIHESPRDSTIPSMEFHHEPRYESHLFPKLSGQLPQFVSFPGRLSVESGSGGVVSLQSLSTSRVLPHTRLVAANIHLPRV